MRLPKNLGNVLLALWLVLFGFSGFINPADLRPITSVLAVIAGMVLLFKRYLKDRGNIEEYHPCKKIQSLRIKP